MLDAERCLLLCGALDFLDKPLMAFIRLRAAVSGLSGSRNAPIVNDEDRPTRHIVVCMSPADPAAALRNKEVGRAMAMAMQNFTFAAASLHVSKRF